MMRCSSTGLGPGGELPSRLFHAGYPALELEAVCALARRHDMAAVELRALGGTLDLAGHCAARFGTPAALARAVEVHGVRVPVVGSSFALTDTDAAGRAGLLALAPWAEAAGARWLRVFDGKDCAAAAAAEMRATLAWWREARRAHGWQIEPITVRQCVSFHWRSGWDTNISRAEQPKASSNVL
jgi:hypothetical protein